MVKDYTRFEADLARRERLRYIREGRIVPAIYMKPQLLVRNPDVKGGWSPEIKHG